MIYRIYIYWSNTPSERGGFKGYAVIPPTPQSPCRPWEPLGDPLGSPGGSLGDPWGSLGDPVGTSWGPLGTLGDSSGTPWGPLGDLRGRPAAPWRSLGDHLPDLLDALGASWGFCGGNFELQRALIGSQRGSRRPVGGVLGAFWKLRKRLRSNSPQYAKTFKFTVRYCKNQCPGKLKSWKINCNSAQNP